MKKCIWVVEDFTPDNGYEDLITEVKRQGFECCVIRYEPFQSGNYDKICNDDDCVVFQGSINLAEQFQREKPNWLPGVYATWENYECTKYYHGLAPYLLNRNYGFYNVSDLLEKQWEIFQLFGEDATIWMRPSTGKKTFTARLVQLEDYDNFVKKWVVPFTQPTDKVVVSTPKSINGEWRFICNRGTIIATSCYIYQGNRIYVPSCPNGARAKCEDVLDFGYYPDNFFAVDICEDSEGKYYLMELNAFSSCGLYKCNKQEIVQQVSEDAVRFYESGKQLRSENKRS